MKKLFSYKTLDQIDVVASPRVRDQIRDDVVAEYLEVYQDKKSAKNMPPPVLFEVEKDKFLIGDGLHRISAILQLPELKKGMWVFEVMKGSYEDCLKYALGANVGHGLRRTNKDKRQAVIEALKSFSGLSNVSLAEMAAVGDDLVAEVRNELSSSKTIPTVTKTQGADGKSRTANLRIPKVESSENVKNKGKSEDSNPVEPEPARVRAHNSEPEKDQLGHIVPDRAMPYWSRRGEVQAVMKQLSEIKCLVEKAADANDLLYVEIGNSVTADLKMIRESLSHALPFAVCPTCNGRQADKCGLCRGRGVVSEARYKTVPQEIRTMREKMVKKGK